MQKYKCIRKCFEGSNQTGDKQGFGDPLYSTIAPGNLVQTGNVTLGLTDNHYTRQSVGGKTNKKL